MKPRTKQHIKVYNLSQALPKLVEKLKPWTFEKCVKHVAFRTKKNTSCLSCGHIYIGDATAKTETCPSCKRKVSVQDSRKKKDDQRFFIAVVDTCEDFQVNRFFEIFTYAKAGAPPRFYMHEVVQQWILPTGKDEVVAMNRDGYYGYFHGNLEIRDRSTLWHKYNIYPQNVYPGAKCLPIYKRNGVTGKFPPEVCPYDLFKKILTDTKAETLLKAKQFDLLGARLGNKHHEVDRNWPSIKICMRNGYKVKDAIIWLDYLQLLAYFKKDLNSPKYVCPADLLKEHTRLVVKKTAIETRKRYTKSLLRKGKDLELLKKMSPQQLKEMDDALELHQKYTDRLLRLGKDLNSFESLTTEQLKGMYDTIVAEMDEAKRKQEEEKKRREFEKATLDFERLKGRFFGLAISSGQLTIKVLESIQEFMDEGLALTHCVYTNKYYTKEDSLILSARIDGKPVETIEISLSKMQILQSRGLQNMPTKYHDDIVKLVNANMQLIHRRKRVKKLKKEEQNIAA